MVGIKSHQVFDGYRFGSERPELLLMLDPVFLGQLGQYPHSVWLNLAQILGKPDYFASDSHADPRQYLIKLYDLICEVAHIAACTTRFAKNLDDQPIWIVPYYDFRTSLGVCHHLLQTIAHLAKNDQSKNDQQFVSRFFAELQSIKSKFDKSVNNYFLLKAAKNSQVAVINLEPGTWQLGHGKNLRIFRSTVTEKTSSLAINWAKDKFMSAYLLNSMGYPGPKHQWIRDEEHLKNAIVALGFPLVIKPRDQEQGRGVSADLRHEDDVISAYRAAQKFSKQILLEKHQDGNTHRLTVIGGELIKVVKRIPGGVYGDGQHAIRDLINLELSTEKNQSRIKRRGYAALSLDEEAMSMLHQQGLNLDDIPTSDTFVKLRRRDNINAGGHNQPIPLHQVHPDNIRLAQSIARDFHLDFIGIDLIIQDISHSWLDEGATICELNGQPQMAAFSDPDLYPNILSRELIDGGRIAIDIVICANHEEAQNYIHHHDLKKDKDKYWTSHDGIYHQEQRISSQMDNSYLSAKSALHRKEIQRLCMLLQNDDVTHYGLPLPVHQISQCWIANDEAQKSLVQSLRIPAQQVHYL
jgi:cyanophycin synthetase